MTDMFTGMPFYWTGANPVNVVPPNQALANNLAQGVAQNQANSQAVSNMSANVGSNANTFDPFAQSGGFGAMTDYYSNLGAAYGRSTGGFGKMPDGSDAPAGRVGTISNPTGLINAENYKQQNPDVWKSGADPFKHWFDFGQKEGRNIQTFNPYQYQSQNKDVWQSGADPFKHYLEWGQKENRPGAWSDFNPKDYQQMYPDLVAAGVDPTAHWFEFGEKEGRKGTLSPLNSYQGAGFDAFDPNIYQGSHPTAGFGDQPTAAAPQQDWGDLWKERGPFNRSPQSGADAGRDALAAAYYANNRDVYDAAKASGQDFTTYGLNHLMAYGDDEGRTFADFGKYGRDNPDIAAAGADPTAHWFQYGSKEGRTLPQSSVFNKETYNLLNPDVAAAGVDPTQHWLQFGQKENRMGGAFESAQSYDQFKGAKSPWMASIPQGRNSSEVISAVNALSQKYGWDPAALAAVIQMESTWDPKKISPTGTYRGMTQMGENTFKDAGGKLGGLTWDQYQKATAAQQVSAYGDWINQGAKVGPGTSASLVKGGIGSLPPEMQAAIMQGTQFSPNATSWVEALGRGDMSMPTTKPYSQAEILKDTSINTMRDVFADMMAKWPSPWPK